MPQRSPSASSQSQAGWLPSRQASRGPGGDGASPRAAPGATIRNVIDNFLGAEDWDEPSPEMDVEEPYGGILDSLIDLVPRLVLGEGSGVGADLALMAKRVLVRAPALVNVPLNYKICAEHGLPFHPTVYYELSEARRYKLSHPIAKIESANRLYRDSIELARAAYRLDPSFAEAAAAMKERLPDELGSFVYTGARDKYTWRGSNPDLIRRLADAILAKGRPGLVVAAAHGSIMPALLLAEFLGADLYFIRFSMFKRQDDAPIVSLADEAWLASHSKGRVLLFDEDVAGGKTLSLFRDRLALLFPTVETACVIRHAGASIKPDFVARTWYD
jgi:hypothetical protein